MGKAIKNSKDILTFALFGIIYYVIHILFVCNMNNDTSTSLEYVIIYFPLFWIMSGICLILLIKLMKISINTWKRKFIVFLLTPFPFIFCIWMYSLTLSPPPETEYIYCNGEQKYQKITYRYKNGNIEKEELYKKSGYFNWDRDSIWIYYNKKGEIIKKEIYENDTLLH